MESNKLNEWIERSRRGDREAQTALLEAAQRKVYYHCKKMLKHEQDAEDATQDVLITILTKLDQLREPAAFWGWVNTLTANRCKRVLTAPHKELQIPEDEDGNSMLDDLSDFDEQRIPAEALDNAETRRMIIELVDELPPDQRMSVLFYYYDEMSVSEIAKAMEASEGTVKSRLNYARRTIKRGVERLERQGVKLYGISPMLLLAGLLRREAESGAMDPAAAAQMLARVTGQTAAAAGVVAAAAAGAGSAPAAGAAATTATGGTVSAAGTAAATAAKGLSVKLVSLLLTGTLLVGGAAGAGLRGLAERARKAEPAVVEPVETPAPTPVPTPAPTPVPTPVPTPEPTLEPKPRINEEDGFHFGTIGGQFDGVMQVYTTADSIRVVDSAIVFDVKDVSCSATDGAGYVTYTLRYGVSYRFSLAVPDEMVKTRELWRWAVSYPDVGFYDAYSGMYLGMGGLYNDDSNEKAMTLEAGGRAFPAWGNGSQLGTEKEESWSRDGEEGYRNVYHCSATQELMAAMRVPADYDGLLLTVDPVDSQVMEDPFRENGEPDDDEPSFWDDEKDSRENTIFMRLTPDTLPRTQTEEEAPAQE